MVYSTVPVGVVSSEQCERHELLAWVLQRNEIRGMNDVKKIVQDHGSGEGSRWLLSGT